MAIKNNLSWINDPTLYGGSNLGESTVFGMNGFIPRPYSLNLGANNNTLQNATTTASNNLSRLAPLNTNMNVDNATQKIATNRTNTSINPINIVSGGANMLGDWFDNLNKPVTEQMTSDTKYVNGFGYTNTNDLHTTSNTAGGGSAALKGAATGASAGAALGPVGSVVGAGIGAIGGFVSNLFGNKSRNAKIRQQNLKIDAENAYNRSSANTNYLKQDYLEDSTFANGGMYLPTIINDMMAKMRTNNVNMHNLNNFATGGEYNKGIIPQLANANAFVDDKETIMSQNGNIDTVDQSNPNMMKIHNGEDGYLASLQDGDMILSNKIKVPGTNKTFAQKGKVLENIINKAKDNKGSRISENTNKLNIENAMNEYRNLFELQQNQKFNKK